MTMRQIKLAAVKAALKKCNGNITHAAKLLRVTPKTVAAILKRG